MDYKKLAVCFISIFYVTNFDAISNINNEDQSQVLTNQEVEHAYEGFLDLDYFELPIQDLENLFLHAQDPVIQDKAELLIAEYYLRNHDIEQALGMFKNYTLNHDINLISDKELIVINYKKAICSRILRRFSDEIEYLNSISRILEISQIESSIHLCRVYIKAAYAYSNLQQDDKFLEQAQKAKDAYEPSLGWRIEAEVYTCLGSALSIKKNYDESVLYFKKAYSLAKEAICSPDDEFFYLYSLYLVYDYFNQHEMKAIIIMNLTELVDKGISNRWLFTYRQAKGLYDYYLRNYEDALKEYNQADEFLDNLSEDERIEIPGRMIYFFYAQKAIVEYYAWKNDKTDLSLLHASYSTSKKLMKVQEDWMNNGILEEASLLNLLKEYVYNADLAFVNGYNVWEQNGDMALLEELYQVLSRSKAYVLRNATLHNEAIHYSGIPDSLRSSEREMKKRLISIRHQLNTEKEISSDVNEDILRREYISIREQYEGLLLEIEKEYPKYYDNRYQHSIPSVKEIQEELAEDQVLVEFNINNNALFQFTILKDTLILAYSDIGKSFADSLLAYRNLLENCSFGSFQADQLKNLLGFSEELYAEIFEPIQDVIYNKRIIAVVDKEMSVIPLESLVCPRDANKPEDISTWDFVLKSNPISTLYSSSQFVNKRLTKSHPDEQILALSPCYESTCHFLTSIDKWKPLQGARKEVDAAGAIFRGKKLQDRDATKQAFLDQASSYNIIHLAMHAELDDNDPMMSSLIFTPLDTTDSHIFRAYEIYGKRLESDLVVLSACNTGRGKVHKGEGVMNMARSFFYSGVKNVIMTHWAVPDHSSATIMKEFYSYLDQELPVDVALQQAKIDYLENQDPLKVHPYYWAGYFVVGNPVRFEKPSFVHKKYVILGLWLISMLLVYAIVRKRYSK